MARFRLAPTLLALMACSALLSACNQDEETAPPVAAPSSAQPSNASSEGSYLYASVNVVDDRHALSGQKIALVDPLDGSLLKTVVVDANATMMAAQSFTLSSDGLSLTAGRDTALYYTHAGALYELGLTKPAAPGEGRQVSSEQHACTLLQVLPKDPAALSSWILLSTAGADGLCETPEDQGTVLVSSDADRRTDAISLGTGSTRQADLIEVQRDEQGGLVNVIMAITERSGDTSGSRSSQVRLVAISSRTGATSEVVGGTFRASGDAVPTVRRLGKVAGSRDQVYVQVGQQVRVLSWSGGVPTLQAAVVATLDTTPLFVHSDAMTTYVVDGRKVLALMGATSSTLTDKLPASEEVLPGGVLGSTVLLLPVREGERLGLRTVSKIDGSIRAVSWDASLAPRVEAISGDNVVISARAGAQAQGALWRLNASAPNLTPVAIAGASQARVITTVRAAGRNLAGEGPDTHVIWCDASVACQAGRVFSLDVLGGSLTSLSPSATSAAAWDDASALSRGTTQGLLSSTAHAGTDEAPLWLSDSLWFFDAAKAGSLTRVGL
jgi:hypothetical protein